VAPPPEVGQHFAKGAWIGLYSGVDSKEAGEEMQNWVRASGADLLADGWQKRLTLLGGWAFDQDTRQADLVEFDRADPEKTFRRLAELDAAMRESRNLETRLSFLQPPGSHPTGIADARGVERSWKQHDTFLFRTAAGSFGILQFGEFRDNPPRVSFRYKLVRQSDGQVIQSAISATGGIQPDEMANKQIAQLKLQSAIRELTAAENQFAVGRITPSELQKAKLDRDTAAAELKGDLTEIARLKLQFAEQELQDAKKRLEVGVMTPSDCQKMEFARDIAAAELKGDAVEVARRRLQFAELELTVTEKRRDAGQATPAEYERAKLARDIATVNLQQVQKASAK
jgi:hypothetical protein